MAPSTSTLIDSSANHYDGTLYGIDSSNFVTDSTGYTLVLNGIDEYAKVVYPLLANSQRASISTLFTASGISTGKRLIDLALEDSANSSRQLVSEFDASSNLVTSLYDLSNTLVGTVTSSPLSTAVPYFVTTNYNGKAQSGGMELFVDSVSINTATPTGNRLSTSAGILHIGKNAYSNDYFGGNISEILISSKNRSADWNKVIGLSIKEQLGTYALTTTVDAVVTTTIINGMPWRQQYTSNLSQSSDITDWVASTSLPVAMECHNTLFTKNRVYLLGIWTGSYNNAVYTAPINTDGTLGTWTTGTSLPVSIFRTQTIITKNRAYLLGGDTGSAISSVYTAPINDDGTLGTWVAGPSLPGNLRWSQAVVTTNRVYLLGGDNGSITATVYTAPINADGTLGTWATGTNIPGILRCSQVINTGSRIYLLGGDNGSTVVSTVYTAPINADGTLGTWTTGTSLPGPMGNSQAIVTKNTVYLLGGSDVSNTVSTVYKAPINTDGTLGTWTTGTSLPGTLRWAQAIVTGSKIYLMGGANTSTVSTVYVATALGGKNDYSKDSYIDSTNVTYTYNNGTPWNNQLNNSVQSGDLTGWSTSGTSLLMGINPAATFITKNYVYLCGGNVTGGGFTTATYKAPINSDGTLGTWTTGTSLPGKRGAACGLMIGKYVYIFGGWDGSSVYNTTYMAPVNTDGTIGTWTTGTNIPTGLLCHSTFLTITKVFIVGGRIQGGTYQSAVYYAPISGDGIIGAWVTAGNSLPGVLAYTQIAVTKNRVYTFGGSTGSTVDTVYTAPINSDGTLGTWSTGTSLPRVMQSGATVVTKNTIYIIGGSSTTAILKAPINSDGTVGTWSDGTNIVEAVYYISPVVTSSNLYLLGGSDSSPFSTSIRIVPFSGGKNDYTTDTYTATSNISYTYVNAQPWNQQYLTNTTQSGDITGWVAASSNPATAVSWTTTQTLVTKNRVYILGGTNGSTYYSNVYTAVINSDGTLGTWSAGTALPGTLARSSLVVTINRAYLCGGWYNGGGTSQVLTAPINSDGTLGTWTVSANSLPGSFYASYPIITKNRVYLCGGSNGSSQSTVYTAPINADGTLGTWASGPSLPVAREAGHAVIVKGRIYYIAGWQSTNKNNIYYAPVYNDGTIGTWVDTGTTCNFSNNNCPVVVTSSTIYIFSGSVLYKCAINSDGTLGTWTTGSNTTCGTDGYSVVITSSQIYIISTATYYAPFTGGKNDYTTDAYSITSSSTNTLASLSFTIPANTITTNQYNIPIMLRLTNPLGTGSLDTTDLFRGMKTNYSTFVGTDIKNRKFGMARDGMADLHLPVLQQSKGILYENNGSMFFSGTASSVIDITNNISRLALIETLTVSLWVFPTAYIASDTLIFGANASEFSIHMNLNAGGIILIKHTGSSVFTSTHYCTLNTWNHIIVTRDTSAKLVSLYQSGNLVFSNWGYATAPAISATAINIGSSTFNGKIADIKIFNRVLTANECMDLYKFSAFAVYKNNITTAIINKNNLLLGESLASIAVQDTTGITTSVTHINGQPWKQQYDINMVQSTDITGWLTGIALPGIISQSSVVVTKNRVYLCGGLLAGANTAIVYTASINSDGTLGTWVDSNNNLPGAIQQQYPIVTKTRVYLCGGWTNQAVTTVYTAPINPDGTLGTWVVGTSLPERASQGSICITKNRVYLIGGYNPNIGDSYYVFTAPINEDGTLGTWNYAAGLPTGRNANPVLVLTRNYLYACGGWTSGVVSSVYYAPLNEDGTLGTWVTGTALPVTIAYNMANIVTRNRVYILGGYISGAASAAVYTAPINADGTLGTWATGTSLPGATQSAQVITTNAYIYVLGGNSSAVYYAPFTGGKNDYSTEVYTTKVLQDNVSVYYALSSDGNTYKTYNNSTWTSIVSSNPAVHGYSEALPYFYDPDNTTWVYEGVSTESAISKAMQISSNRMDKTVLNSINNFASVFDVNNGNVNLAVSMYSDGVRNVKLTDIKLNNKNYWVSDPYDLTIYCSTVTAANIYVQFIGDYTAYAPSFKVYCLITGGTSWVECTNNNIPNIPTGLITTGKYATFRVVWDLAIQASPIDVSLELVVH
ncbi:hypothetical protein JZU46_02920 [bacterium]|nr:hypothetical protein [bacterium]